MGLNTSKRNIYLFLLVFTAFVGIGQNNTLKYVSNTNIWQMSSPAWVTAAGSWQVSFSKDSVLIGAKYYFEKIIDDKKNPGWKGTNSYFRQEDGKVYNLKNQGEVLHYNFDLTLGDSVNVDDHGLLNVLRINDTLTLDGQVRKKIILNKNCVGSNQGSIIWIEGIGEVKNGFSIPFSCTIADPEPSMDCFLQNDKVVFSEHFCLDPYEYKKMVSHQYIWQVAVSKSGLPGVIDRLYRFGGNKYFNGKLYTELLKSEGYTKTSVLWNGTGMFFREEGNVIYYLDHDSEIPYFDFNLSEGDSFAILYGVVTNVHVVKTDTIYLEDNKPRKRFYLGCDSLSDDNEVEWIEGIGDVSSFLYSLFSCTLFDPTEVLSLKCVLLANNYKEIFRTEGVQGCFLANVLNLENNRNKYLTVYPNPTSGMIKIKSEVPLRGKIFIRDFSGKILLEKIFDQGMKMEEINIENFHSGIYLYTFRGENGKYFYGKIIVQ